MLEFSPLSIAMLGTLGASGIGLYLINRKVRLARDAVAKAERYETSVVAEAEIAPSNAYRVEGCYRPAAGGQRSGGWISLFGQPEADAVADTVKRARRKT